jgi:hypothetical protein
MRVPHPVWDENIVMLVKGHNFKSFYLSHWRETGY